MPEISGGGGRCYCEDGKAFANTYFLEYDSFMSDPFKHVSKIIKTVDGSVDEEKLKKIIEKLNVSKKFDIKKSNLYIEDFNKQYGLDDVIFDPEDKFLN